MYAKNAWTNEHFRVTRAGKLLDAMSDVGGPLRKVRRGTRAKPSSDGNFVAFGYEVNSGWVLADRFDEAVVEAGVRSAEERRGELRGVAEAAVLARHIDEVETELAHLLSFD